MTMQMAVRHEPLVFTEEQRKMIRDTFANGASDAEFAVLLEVARARRINPLLRQVHFVSRWDTQKSRFVWAVQVSIDGLRAIAERTGLYAGQDDPEFVEAEDGTLKLCKVRVYRKDWPRPAVGTAYWEEYVQTRKDKATGKQVVTEMWRRMPHVMLAKCAESLALRKAFPEDMSGLYTGEEMAQAGNDLPEPTVEVVRSAPAALPAPEKSEGSRAFARFCAVIDSVPGCVAVWGEYSDLQRGLHEEGADVAEYLDGATGGYARAANRLRTLCPLTEAEIRAVLSARDGELAADLDGMDTASLDAAARWWLGGGKPEDATRAAVVWRALARKAAGVDVDPVATGKATKALKAACTALTPPDPPTGTDAPAASEQVAAEGAAAQSDGADWTRSPAGMRAHLAGKTVVRAVLNSVVAHGALRGYATLAAERIQALTGWDLDTAEAQISDAFAKADERRERASETAAMVRRAA